MKRMLLLWAVLGTLAWAPSGALAAKPYTLIPLEGLPGETSVPAAWYLNESGMIAGTSGTHPVRWDAGSTTPTLLGGLGNAFMMRPQGIDPAGAVYGYAQPYAGGGNRPVRWDAGSTAAVQLAGLGTDASGNPNGMVTAVGASGLALGVATEYSNGQSVGFKVVSWSAGSSTPTILHDAFLNGQGANPLDTNASGTMVERTYYGVPSYPRPLRWNAATEPQGTRLETLDDPQYYFTYQMPTYANAINDAGVAVGYSVKTTRSSRNEILSETQLGARWEPGQAKITAIPSLRTANDINNAGAIVGDAGFGAGVLLYPGNKSTDLTSLVDAGAQWDVATAFKINDRGQILGQARYDADGPGPGEAVTRAVLLDPKPLLADANRDMKVDFADFQILEVNFGNELVGLAPVEARARGDFNTDGKVDSSDFGVLQDQFGWWIPALSSSETSVSVVPEPGALFAACMAVILVRRRLRR